MSTFWTPGGEHPVGQPDDGAAQPARGGQERGGQEQGERASEHDAAGLDDLTPEGRAQLEAEAAEMTAQLAGTPAAVVVANHVVGLFQLAAIHLNEDPPHLDDGRLAIDAVKALLDAVGDRLGEQGEALRTGLTQLQLAYVQLHRRDQGGDPLEGTEPTS